MSCSEWWDGGRTTLRAPVLPCLRQSVHYDGLIEASQQCGAPAAPSGDPRANLGCDKVKHRGCLTHSSGVCCGRLRGLLALPVLAPWVLCLLPRSPLGSTFQTCLSFTFRVLKEALPLPQLHKLDI